MDTAYKNAYLDAGFGSDHTADFPATVYLALFLQSGVEVSGGSYARKAVTNNSTNFPDASGGSKSNGVAIAFAAASADWGVVYTHKWMSALSGGSVIHSGALTTPTAVANTQIANFPIGSVVITANDA